jgi:hypothetical protein
VLAVASRARRLAEADVRELRAVGPQAEPDAAALADLLGLRLG